MEIYHQYVRLRKQFGRHPRFVDEGAEMLADIRPNEEHAQEYISKNPVLTVRQCVAEMSEHEANTNAVTFSTKAISHVEGGWPKDVDYSEAEHTIRYRKKVEKDEDYIHTITALGAAIEDLVKQNNAIDIYQVRQEHACMWRSRWGDVLGRLFSDTAPAATYCSVI
jgi:dynein intermediate chain 2